MKGARKERGDERLHSHKPNLLSQLKYEKSRSKWAQDKEQVSSVLNNELFSLSWIHLF